MSDNFLLNGRVIPIDEYIQKYLYLKHEDGEKFCIKEIFIPLNFLNSISSPEDLKYNLKTYLTEEDLVRMILLGIDWSKKMTKIDDNEMLIEYKVSPKVEYLYLNEFIYLGKERTIIFKIHIKNYILTLLDLEME